jgi:hypothetical protein
MMIKCAEAECGFPFFFEKIMVKRVNKFSLYACDDQNQDNKMYFALINMVILCARDREAERTSLRQVYY